RAAWATFEPLKEATDQLKNPKVRVHLFDSTVLPALCYGAETWVDTSTTSRMLRTTHKVLERCVLKYNRHSQYLTGCEALTFEICHIFEIQDTSRAKHRWAGHIMRRTDDRWTKRTIEWTPRECKRLLGRPPTRWA
ncbi:hypothetical protein Angca_003175, partial [Angiostrongylus cantonensis]